MAAADSHEKFLRDLIGDPSAAERILSCPPVAEAVRRGTRAGIYDALAKARRSPLMLGDREVIDRARAKRRMFLDPVGSAPTMFTINGIGTRLYGKSEADAATGTHVATLYVTFVYLPLFPIGCYLVAPAGGRAWRFLAKVPRSSGHRLWRRGLAGGVAAAALAVWLAARHTASHSDVWFVNGLDVPVSVAMGDQSVRAAPGSTQTRNFSAGAYHLVARTEAGNPVEEIDVQVPGKTDLVAYNVLGAAPLGIDEVVYSSATVREQDSSGGQALVGESWVVRDHVEYPFQTPPKTIRMSGAREVRRASSVSEGGWRTSVSYLFQRGDRTKAVDLASRVALAQRDEPAIALAGNLASSVGPEEEARFAERAAALVPTSIEAHRCLQTALTHAGRKAEARARYQAGYEKDVSSAAAGYLYVRVLPRGEALPLTERLVREHPDDAWIRRSMGWSLLSERRFADAAPQYARLKELDARIYADVLSNHVRALAGSGRVPDAQRLLEPEIRPGGWEALVLYAKLGRLPDADRSLPEPADLLARLQLDKGEVGRGRAQIASEVRDRAAFERLAPSIEDNAIRESDRLDVLAFADLEAAAAGAETAPDAALAALDQVTRLALVCELLRTGREAGAKKVYDASKVPVGGYLRFETLRSPAAALDDDDIDIDLRAGLCLAASRRAQETAERDRWLALARAYDVLRCVVPP